MKGREFTAEVHNMDGLRQVLEFLNGFDFENKPCKVTIESLKDDRSSRQNRMMHQWFKDCEKADIDTAEEIRKYAKLHFGIVILRRDSDEFREQYNRLILNRYTYEEKLELMGSPIDYPVTRIMKVDQMSEFLTSMWNHYTGLGVRLTDPSTYKLDLYPEAK